MGDQPQRGRGGGFIVSVFLIIVLFSIFLLPDISKEFSLSLPTFPDFGTSSLKSAIATPLLELSFKYIGANEYIERIPNTEEEFLDEDILTLLMLGVAGEGHISPFLTDSILILRLDLKENNGVAISLPRDLLVQIPESTNYTKINALYRIGLGHDSAQATYFIEKKIEDIVGFPVSRIVTIDLASFTRVVDALGGITLYIEESINDTRFPTPDGGYTTFKIKKGWQHLDGETASQYIRTRHTPKGDIARIERQQQVAHAIKKKISGLHPLFDIKTIFDVLNSFKGNLKTSLAPEEITYLWLHQRDFREEDIIFRSIDAFEKDSLLIPKTEVLGGKEASVLIPRAGIENYTEIQQAIQKWIHQ